MKFLLSLLLMPLVMAKFEKLTKLSDMGKCEDIDNENDNPYVNLYTVPYADAEADIKQFLLFPDKTPLKFPTNNIIDSQAIGEKWKTCLDSTSTVDLTKMTGKVYFVADEYKNTTVHQWRTEDYPVESSARYIVIFSSDSTGSTLKNFNRDDSTSFVVYSGLPGDTGSAALYAEEDAELRVDEIYLPDDHFYIDNQGGKLQFDVVKGGTTPTKQTFKTNGFILSPGFPTPPTNDNKNANISIVKDEADRTITLQVTSATTDGGLDGDANMIQLASATKSGVHVTVGDGYIFIPPGSAGSTKFVLPGNTDQFQISSDVAYAVQFNIAAAPVTSTTTASTTAASTTTAKPGVSTTTASGASVGSAATLAPATCPPVTQCSCLSSTTEIPTTTQSATMSSLISAVTVFITYQLL